MHYAATRDDPRVTKLALVAAAGPCMMKSLDRLGAQPGAFFDDQIALIEGGNAINAFQQFYAVPTADPAMGQWLLAMFNSASPLALAGGVAELRDRDLTDEVQKISETTRIFHGIWDLLVCFALAKEQERLIIGAKLVRFWWSGHGLFFEERVKLDQELGLFA